MFCPLMGGKPYSILIRLLEQSSSEAGETWVRNMAAEFCLQSIFHARKVLLHGVNMRHGTDDFTSSEGSRATDFFTRKNPSSSAGFEPANLGSSGKRGTTRSPRATRCLINNIFFLHLYMYIGPDYTFWKICNHSHDLDC
jgi:hypothetical protein